MTLKKAACREIGALVKAKAICVTSVSECKRRFGTRFNTEFVTGVVKEVIVPPKGSGKQTSLRVEWSLGDELKSKEVKICNIQLCHAQQDTAASTTGPVTGDADDNVDQSERTTVQDAVTNPSKDVITVHNTPWVESEISQSLNGTVLRRNWYVSHASGQRIMENESIAGLTPYDYFTWMFPMHHLEHIVTLTNAQLVYHQKSVTNGSEILKFFGTIVLMSRFEFGPRRDLWNSVSKNKYISAPNFGQIMPYHRFESLRTCIRFSNNGLRDDDGAPNRWGLVDDFVRAINMHREMYVSPSEVICVDESMSRWYGLGGDWIDVGLPTYRAIDRKPENGCEIKNSACGRSGIMLRLRIVKSPCDEERNGGNNEQSHGTTVTTQLIEPWKHTNRIVCGDSYFASVQTAQALYQNGLRFIGVVKTSHRKFPQKYLGEVKLNGRGNWFSMVHHGTEGNCDMGAVLWVDRERRHFISSVGTTLPGANIYRERWRRIGNESMKTVTETRVPQIAETYYAAAAQIDRHNRCRQKDLQLEKKFMVREWSIRVNTSLLAICIVDSWLLYKGSQGSRDIMSPNAFYSRLSEQLIDNQFNGHGTRSTTVTFDTSDVTVSGIGPHLTPTTRKRKRADNSQTNAFLQGRCTQCNNGYKTKYTCSHCTKDKKRDVWICHSSTGRNCFSEHLDKFHLTH